MSFFRSMGLIVVAPFFAYEIFVTTAAQADPLRFSADNFLESRPHLGDYVDSITEVEAAKDEEDWKEDDEEVRGQIKEINLAQGDFQKTVAGLSDADKAVIKELLRQSGIKVGD